MCHYFIGFKTYDRLPKSRAMWRCSACGRESQVPIDCCVQPAFAKVPQPGMRHVVCQWLQAIASQAVAGLVAIRQRHRSSDADIGVTGITAADMDVEVTDPLLLETDTEIAELEETTHVSV